MFWTLHYYFSKEKYEWVLSERSRVYEIRRTGYAKGKELFPSWGRSLVLLDLGKIWQNMIPSENEKAEKRRLRQTQEHAERAEERRRANLVELIRMLDMDDDRRHVLI